MSGVIVMLLVSAGINGMVASHRQRSAVFWLALGLVAGPAAVVLLILLPSRGVDETLRRNGAARGASVPARSIAEEINTLDEMRQRGIISEDEFRQGKVQVLAWPIASSIPPALTPQQVWADGRRTWASYQPATRAALIDLARRHDLELRWRDDVPLELVATFPIQPGLSVEFSLGLEKGAIYCWGPDWDMGSTELHRPDIGLPTSIGATLDALIEGTGRIVTRTAIGAVAPFSVSFQMMRKGRWRTLRRRLRVPSAPLWRTDIIRNTDVRSPTTSP